MDLLGSGRCFTYTSAMFPFCMPHTTDQKTAYKAYKQHQLNMLKAMRDSAETHLAALNAAVEKTESQIAQLDAETPSSQTAV